MNRQLLVIVLAIGMSRGVGAQEEVEPLPPMPGAETAEPETAEPEAPETPPAEEVEALEETMAAGVADRLAGDDASVPIEAREALDGAVAALVAADHATARELLARVRALLPGEHWLLPTVARLEQLANVVERGLAGSDKEDESVASLYVTLTLYGLWSGAWLFGILAEMDEQAAIPLSVVTAGIGLGAAYLLDHRDEPLTGAVADGISAGIALGAAEAVLITLAIDPEFLFDEFKASTSLIWGSSLVGAVIGGYATRAVGASRGDVALSTAAYTWGAVLGISLALMLDAPDYLPELMLGGATAGFGGGLALASYYDVSPTRVLYVNLGGLGGALVGLGIMVGGSFDSPESIGATVALTYGGGLALGWYLTRNLDLPEAPVAFNAAPTLIPSPDPARAPAPGMAFSLTW